MGKVINWNRIEELADKKMELANRYRNAIEGARYRSEAMLLQSLEKLADETDSAEEAEEEEGY